jgi:hypothetical protein
MRRGGSAAALACAVAAVASASGPGGPGTAAAGAGSARSFSDPTRIDNPYLPLTAHRTCSLRGRADDGTRERSVKTVLRRTKRFTIDGTPVEAAIIRDNAYEDGALVESTLDYFAQANDGTVLYLGEDVRNIRRGRVVNRHGTWLYGRDTDVPGVAMPPAPELGQQWRLEDVPGVTTESDRVEETGLRARVRGRIVTGVIRVQEFIQPEGEVEYKLYAPGIGVVAEYPPDGRVVFAGCSG